MPALILILIVLTSLFVPSPSRSANSCTISVSPSTLSSGTNNYTFTISNSGSESIAWIRISPPSSLVTITNGEGASDWNVSTGDDYIELTGGSLSASSSLDITAEISVSSSITSSDSTTWTANVYTDQNGSNQASCSTSTAQPSTTPTPTPVTITITAPDTNSPTVTLNQLSTTTFQKAPTISGFAVDDKGVTSADYSLDEITWTSVNQIDSKGEKKTNLSFTPTASKTGKYTYKVRARDSSGNFSTAVSVSFEIDQTPPTVACTTTRKINPESPPISCQTSDNQSVSKLEYSQDAGVTWTTITNNSFTPTAFEEGNYSVLIRAEDLVGNLSANYTQEFIIDRLPPRLGSLTVLTDTLAIPPKTYGVFVLPQSKTLKLFTPILGGPILTRLSSTTQTSPESSMTIQPNSIFWTGDLVTDKSGIHDISITATDGVGNLTQKSYGQVFVFEEGVISSDKSFPLTAKIAIYKKNWETESFVFNNSQNTNPNGKYSLYLTPGTFYLEFSAPGHVSKTSEVFTLKSPSYISENITLASKGNFLNNLWQQISNQPSQTITPITHKKESENAPISFPEFSILDPLTKGEVTHISIRSRPTVVTILDSWSPTTSVQISELKKLYVNRPDIRVVVIIPGETPNFVSIFRNRTGSDFPILPDPTYDLSSKLGYASSPSHFILNREAEIIEKLEGLTTNESLSDLLL